MIFCYYLSGKYNKQILKVVGIADFKLFKIKHLKYVILYF